VASFAILAVIAVSLVLTGLNYGRYASLSRIMVPTAQIPFELIRDKNVNPGVKENALLELEKQYPKDPLPHLYLGLEYYSGRNLPAAIGQLTAGLANEHILRTQHHPNIRQLLRRYLVTSYLRQHDLAIAKAVAGKG
jgi:hypothetical protein